jgi:hypothetical protein
MKRRILAIAAISAGVLASGGATLAVANSVSTTPDSQFISHTEKSGVSDHPEISTTHRIRHDDTGVTTVPPVTIDDNGGLRGSGSDDAATRDDRVTHDDPATHDLGADHGTDNTAPASVSPVTPVTVDDHGTDNTTPASVTPITPVTVDDNGGSGHGGSGSGGGGTDDGASHN